MDGWEQALMLGLGVVGVACNVLLLGVSWLTSTGRHRLNLQMVGPIAALDLLACLLTVAQHAASYAMGHRQLLESAGFCMVVGTAQLFLPCLALAMLALMAVDRYCLVVHGRGIRCLHGWLAGAAVGSALALLYVGDAAMHGMEPDPAFVHCRPATLSHVALGLKAFFVLVGLGVVAFCYGGIYLHYRRSLVTYYTMPRRYLILLGLLALWLPEFVASTWRLVAKHSTLPQPLSSAAHLCLALLHIAHPCLVIGFQCSLRREMFDRVLAPTLRHHSLLHKRART